MSHIQPTTFSQPPVTLKARGAIGFRTVASVSESRATTRSSKTQIHELVGEAYAVLSVAGIIGVLVYHMAG